MKKQSLITILLTVLMSMSGAKAFAYNISVKNDDGVYIYYNWINNNTELAVCRYAPSSSIYYSNEYAGKVVIPEFINYNMNTYPVTSISSNAFSDCRDLTSVTIPNSVTSIGESAFSGCSSLYSVTIPNSVTTIGSNAFYGTAWYDHQPDGLVYAGMVAYKFKGEMPYNTHITLKDGTTDIVGSAFYNCTGLTSVTIPNSVKYIGKAAFSGCSSLYYVSIPNSVTSVSGQAFSGCSSLNSVYIGNGVTSIDYETFRGCSSLTSVTIPQSVTYIGRAAFSGCYSLTSVKVSVTAFSSFCNNKVIDLIRTEIGIPIQLIDYNGKEITEYIVPNYVKTIGNNAFYNCSGLTSVTIGNNVESIGESAFSGCSGLTTITIPNSVTSIGDYAFSNCTRLFAVTILIDKPFVISNNTFNDFAFFNAVLIVPKGTVNNYKNTKGWNNFADIEESGNSKRGKCGESVLYNFTNFYIGYDDSDLLISGKGEMFDFTDGIVSPWKSYCNDITSVIIYPGVTSIGSNAFSDCRGLTYVEIPNSVTSIGNDAFRNCSDLTSVNISDLAAWCNIKFSNYNSNPLNYAHHLYIKGNEITNLVIPNSVFSIRESAFSGCSGLNSITIPNSVAYIGESAFSGCSGLTSVTIPNSVISIGGCAFSDCIGLSSITIPNSVTNIDHQAFTCCTNLTSVTIGSNVESIGNYVFAFDYGLTSITFLGSTPPIISDYTFDSMNKNYCILWVPKGSAAAYKEAYGFRDVREFTSLQKGDVNSDGKVDNDDLSDLVGYIMGNKPNGVTEESADVNGDTKVNVADVVALTTLLK